jgi:hypothetical protein
MEATMTLENVPYIVKLVLPRRRMVMPTKLSSPIRRAVGATFPSLPDIADWEAYEAARQNMIPKLSLSSPAVRYGDTPA